MTTKCQCFALKIILIESIGGSYMPNEFSGNSDKFSPLPSPLDLHLGRKRAENPETRPLWRLKVNEVD